MSSDNSTEPNEVGRSQFYDYETIGKKPVNPDPFYERLCVGKKCFNILQSSIRDTYLTWEWWGFYQYWLDWKGQRWVLRYLFNWCHAVPSWLFSEETTEIETEWPIVYIDPNTLKKVDK